jgi:putative hydrolase of the HAD superfamily
MALQYALFDLDETLYDRKVRLLPAFDDRCVMFIADLFALFFEAANQKRLYYNKMYGTVLRGLLQEETVDIGHYLTYIHEVPVHDFLRPSAELSRVLAEIPLRKYIFTNSYRKHAENVINVLEIADHFDGIFDIQSVDYVSKPARHSYMTVVSLLDTEPEACVFIDDQVRNMEEPKMLGMKTILIDAEPNEWVDIKVDSILDVSQAIKQLNV